MVNNPKIDLTEEIISQIKKHGKARFEFGIFYAYKRKNAKWSVLHGQKNIRKVRTYRAVFFRASDKLKREIKKMK